VVIGRIGWVGCREIKGSGQGTTLTLSGSSIPDVKGANQATIIGASVASAS